MWLRIYRNLEVKQLWRGGRNDKSCCKRLGGRGHWPWAWYCGVCEWCGVDVPWNPASIRQTSMLFFLPFHLYIAISGHPVTFWGHFWQILTTSRFRKNVLLVQSQYHPSQQHKFWGNRPNAPSYFLTIKIMISSILLAQLVLMHDRYKSPNFFYSKYSILINITRICHFSCQQHYFGSTIADESFPICPSPQVQLEGDAGKILLSKNTLHTPGRLYKRT